MGRGLEKNLFCVILAAGLGTRMKSSLPKVLHPICGKPMLFYPLEAVRRLRPARTVVVVGKNSGPNLEALGMPEGVSLAVQKEQKGTAHALLAALPSLTGSATVLVLNGDAPFVTPATLSAFLKKHKSRGNAVSVLSFVAKEPSTYGRITRNPLRIVEEKDAGASEKAIKEVNSGVYAIEADALPMLKSIKMNKKKGEYYLTDLVEAAVGKGRPAGVFCMGREEEFLGVNSRKDLAKANAIMRRRIVEGWLEKGVSFLDASSVLIDDSVRIGRDTVIYPGVCLEGNTVVGKNCTIYPNVRMTHSTVRDGAVIKDSTVIEHSVVGAGAQVGPFARLRPESRIGDSAKIGNFVEVKKSIIGRGSKAMHLSYIGDATVGRNVNVGAGTITCNYDGTKKYRTTIGNGVFVGSDSQFVAPVKVGRGAYIGAGSVITENVPPGSLAVSRARQVNIKGWAKRKKG